MPNKGKKGKGKGKGTFGNKGKGKGHFGQKGNWAGPNPKVFGKGQYQTNRMPRACFGRGSLDHVIANCPGGAKSWVAGVGAEEESDGVIVIGSVAAVATENNSAVPSTGGRTAAQRAQLDIESGDEGLEDFGISAKPTWVEAVRRKKKKLEMPGKPFKKTFWQNVFF